MPLIETKTTVTLSDEQIKQMTKKLGEAISLLRGKSEQWLMLDFQGSMKMAFRGKSDDDIAIAEVKIFGRATNEEYDSLTAEICRIYHEILGVGTDRIYVKYEEVEHWGYDGYNF